MPVAKNRWANRLTEPSLAKSSSHTSTLALCLVCGSAASKMYCLTLGSSNPVRTSEPQRGVRTANQRAPRSALLSNQQAATRAQATATRTRNTLLEHCTAATTTLCAAAHTPSASARETRRGAERHHAHGSPAHTHAPGALTLVSRADDHMSAPGRQYTRGFLADAAGGPCDDHHFATHVLRCQQWQAPIDGKAQRYQHSHRRCKHSPHAAHTHGDTGPSSCTTDQAGVRCRGRNLGSFWPTSPLGTDQSAKETLA